MKPLILFDFDGTIADSLDELIKSFNVVLGRRGITKKLTRKHMRTTPARKLMKQFGVRFWSVPGLYREIVTEFESRIDAVSVHEHIPALLESLAPHAQLGVVSSNSPEVVRLFLSKHNLLSYLPTVHGGLLFGKHTAIRKVARSLHASAVLYVGDEVRDVLAAQRARAHSLAVTWGLQDASVLLNARPSMMATSADEAKELLLAWVQSRL